MKSIALSILSVGLCFYVAWYNINGGGIDYLAAFISFIAAVMVLAGND